MRSCAKPCSAATRATPSAFTRSPASTRTPARSGSGSPTRRASSTSTRPSRPCCSAWTPPSRTTFVKAIVERRQQRPFLTLNELNQLKGAPPNFVTKARESLLTVWGDGKVNINTAPPAVLASLGMDEEHMKKIEEFRKGSRRPRRNGRLQNSRRRPALPRRMDEQVADDLLVPLLDHRAGLSGGRPRDQVQAARGRSAGAGRAPGPAVRTIAVREP